MIRFPFRRAVKVIASNNEGSFTILLVADEIYCIEDLIEINLGGR